MLPTSLMGDRYAIKESKERMPPMQGSYQSRKRQASIWGVSSTWIGARAAVETSFGAACSSVRSGTRSEPLSFARSADGPSPSIRRRTVPSTTHGIGRPVPRKRRIGFGRFPLRSRRVFVQTIGEQTSIGFAPWQEHFPPKSRRSFLQDDLTDHINNEV